VEARPAQAQIISELQMVREQAVSMTTDEFATFVRSEATKWAKLVESSGATAD